MGEITAPPTVCVKKTTAGRRRSTTNTPFSSPSQSEEIVLAYFHSSNDCKINSRFFAFSRLAGNVYATKGLFETPWPTIDYSHR